MPWTCKMIKAVRTHKQRARPEEEGKEERNKRMCIVEAVGDLGTVLTFREKGTTEVDPRPSHDDESGNNEAEYEAAIAGLQLSRGLEAKHVSPSW